MQHTQYRDERFERCLAGLRSDTKLKRAAGPWILALPRPDLDPSSRSVTTSHVDYKINAKVNQVAVMHVLSVGPGRVRMGWREHMPVSQGDLVLVNLREAGHWMSLGLNGGVETLYLFTADVPFARIYRTDKPETPPLAGTPERDAWHDAWSWNISDVLSDYVLLGRDPEAERYMSNGPRTLLHVPGTLQTDGLRSDDSRDSRFPIIYRRVLGVGPGRWMTRENDLGMVEREETKSEAKPGDMMALCRTVQAAAFTFQGAPLEVIHAASTLIYEETFIERSVEVHESVPIPLTWTDPGDDDEEEPDPPPEAA
jgi:hypothetical protein